MTREETRDKLIQMIDPLVESKGFELVHLDYVVGKHGRLHLFIDHEDGIAIDHCELISRAVSDMLDTHDPITHAYTLEVSSPGLERPLSKQKHFERFQGEKVKIRTGEPVVGSSKFSGTLKDSDDEKIVILKEDGLVVEIPYDLITRANLWYPGPAKKEKKKN